MDSPSCTRCGRRVVENKLLVERWVSVSGKVEFRKNRKYVFLCPECDEEFEKFLAGWEAVSEQVG